MYQHSDGLDLEVFMEVFSLHTADCHDKEEKIFGG
jgi:hypothetical protein